MTNPPLAASVADAILRLASEKGQGRTLCPTDVARFLSGSHPDAWGPIMPAVRRAAVALMKEGRILILRKGKLVDPDDFRGVYRLALPREE